MRVSAKRTIRTAFTALAVVLASGCGDIPASLRACYEPISSKE